MFENFPYTDLHQLNLDWIIKIAKDFLDQYTSIQKIISDGIENLDSEYENLSNLLNEWYESHSNEIAEELTRSLERIANTLNNAIITFDTHADSKAAETIASIPDDYTTLFNTVNAIRIALNINKTVTPGYVLTASDDEDGVAWTMAGNPTDEQVGNAVSAWLAAHPDVTTTVQDGSLTEVKFSDSLKLKTIKEYVTPEMFGAMGDGVTDDTTAIQTALNTGKAVYFTTEKVYRADHLIAPIGTYIIGNNSEIKAVNSQNTIITITRDTVIKNLKISGISNTILSANGIELDNAAYRIILDDIKISYCNYGIKDNNGIWSFLASHLWFLGCEHGFHITHSASTSVNIDSMVFENCGAPLYFKNVNYSNIGILYGDYNNGGEEESWAYPVGHGSRSDNLYYFEGCKGLNIGAMAGENNIGKFFCRIEYSNLSIHQVYCVKHISYESTNRCLIRITSEVSKIYIGPFQYYKDNSVQETIYDAYIDYPYNFAYGEPEHYLLTTVDCSLSERTPLRVVNNNSLKKPIHGVTTMIMSKENVQNKTYLKLMYKKSSGYYLPIATKIVLELADQASDTWVIEGNVFAQILINNTVQIGTNNITIHKPGSSDTAATLTAIAGGIAITLPNGIKTAWLTIEDYCSETEISYSFTDSL